MAENRRKRPKLTETGREVAKRATKATKAPAGSGRERLVAALAQLEAEGQARDAELADELAVAEAERVAARQVWDEAWQAARDVRLRIHRERRLRELAARRMRAELQALEDTKTEVG